MFIYACECIGLRNIVIMMYMYLAMLYPINDLNLNLNLNLKGHYLPNRIFLLPVKTIRYD